MRSPRCASGFKVARSTVYQGQAFVFRVVKTRFLIVLILSLQGRNFVCENILGL